MITRLGLYGHSICTNDSTTKGSYQQMLVKRFPTLEIVNIGSGNCSEERIFYELKKTKNLDIAVIFHSRPGAIFIPNANRDMYVTPRGLKSSTDYQWNHLIRSNGIRKVFPDLKTFYDTFDFYMSYLSTPDLEKNRFESALLAIDSYCLSDKIKLVIHVPCLKYIPNWFSFRSGVVNEDLIELSLQQDNSNNPNCLNDGINERIAEVLGMLIEPYINKS
jgi:hypothetical protein